MISLLRNPKIKRMGILKPGSGGEGGEGRFLLNDPTNAALELAKNFDDLQARKEVENDKPPSDPHKYMTDEDYAMGEDEATRFRIEQAVDAFLDTWREDLNPAIKDEVAAKLHEMGREDVLKQLDL